MDVIQLNRFNLNDAKEREENPQKQEADSSKKYIKALLIEALADLEEDTTIAKANKILILPLDTKNELYDYGFYQTGMNMSECIALLEIAKQGFLEQMGIS